MTSESSSSAPSSLVTKKLVTDSETYDINGKLRCLTKLLKHPRANLPELSDQLTHLLVTMNTLILCNTQDYTKASREMVDKGFRTMAILEELIIRVILQNETVKDVFSELMNKYKVPGYAGDVPKIK